MTSVEKSLCLVVPSSNGFNRVNVSVLLYPNIILNVGAGGGGGGGIFRKRENSLFLGLKWTTAKLYNLRNYCCL